MVENHVSFPPGLYFFNMKFAIKGLVHVLKQYLHAHLTFGHLQIRTRHIPWLCQTPPHHFFCCTKRMLNDHGMDVLRELDTSLEAGTRSFL